MTGSGALGSTVAMAATWVEADLAAGAIVTDGTYPFVIQTTGSTSAQLSPMEGLHQPELVVMRTP